jgi:hypothetical protein
MTSTHLASAPSPKRYILGVHKLFCRLCRNYSAVNWEEENPCGSSWDGEMVRRTMST